jgi:hypothetical protein
MSSPQVPVILIEVVLVFGGVLAFGWWQLRSVSRDQRKAAEDRKAKAECRDDRDARVTPAPPTD